MAPSPGGVPPCPGGVPPCPGGVPYTTPELSHPDADALAAPVALMNANAAAAVMPPATNRPMNFRLLRSPEA